MANPQIEKTFPRGERLCPNEEATRRAAHDLVACLGSRAALSLEGPMGAGKTCFVKGLAEALGCDPRDVSSPTFTLIHEYHGARLPLVHMDLYRLESASELAQLGFDDYLSAEGVVAIEWGGKFSEMLPPHTLRLVFSIEGTARRIQIQS
jgi:tRNA threonylcarbamoyladenosine biosynthesis protein TsaE